MTSHVTYEHHVISHWVKVCYLLIRKLTERECDGRSHAVDVTAQLSGHANITRDFEEVLKPS